MADKRRGRKKVAEKLPKGTVLTDVAKEQWEIGEPIGEGGFGVIYSAKKVGSAGKKDLAFAAKVEPHGNGPLFVEKTFFLKFLKPEMLAEYKQRMKLSFLGLPEYHGGGSHRETNNETVHRFLIMQRFGENISKKLKSSTELNFKLLGTYCTQIIDSLMYIHDKGYAHMDVKSDNLLLKLGKDDQVFLVDFGIIDVLTKDDVFKPDKKKQHNGTLLYTSRDSHLGVATKRGDLEILGYNILEWCGFELPWAKDVKNPAVVHEKKNKFIADVRKELASKVPENVIKYFTYVNSLKHNETPNYQHVKSLLQSFDSLATMKTSQKRKMNKSVVPLSPKNIMLSDDDGVEENVNTKKSKSKVVVTPRKGNIGSSGDKLVKKTSFSKNKSEKTKNDRTPEKNVRRGRSAMIL